MFTRYNMLTNLLDKNDDMTLCQLNKCAKTTVTIVKTLYQYVCIGITYSSVLKHSFALAS